jgi:hypothetical protein
MDFAFFDTLILWPGSFWIGLLIAASWLNIRFRLDVEETLGWPSDQAVRLPEKQWNYEAQGLRNFVEAVGGAKSEAMTRYIRVLRVSDIAFAVALAGTTAYLWYWIATLAPPPELQWAYPYLTWLAAPLGAMGVIYGISDIAEDLKLAKILNDGDRIDAAEAAAANMLTRIKMASLGASLIGIALFVPVAMAHDLGASLRKRQRVPIPRA